MNKLIYILLVIIFSAGNIFSQSPWYPQFAGTTENINAVYFLNTQTGFVSGGNIIHKTINGGSNWSSIVLPDTTNILSIRFLNNTTGYACGGILLNTSWSRQHLFKTTNAGENWIKILEGQGFNSIEYFNDVFPIDSLVYVTRGGRNLYTTVGSLYRSQNNGLNFSTITVTSDEILEKLSFINSQTGWVTSTFGSDVSSGKRKIFKTTNQGQNWVMQYRDTLNIAGMSLNDMEIQLLNQNTGYSLYNRNLTNTKFLKTTNSGVSWDSISLPYNNSKTMFFIDENTGWIGGNYSDGVTIIRTSTGGANWPTTWSASSTTHIYSIYFANNFTGWAVGSGGNIYRSWTSGLAGVMVQNISSETPSSYSLSQNYPNPFNPVTTINFAVPKQSLVLLKIYDMLGREIKHLVNEIKNSGYYSVDFNASDFVSGVYFYRLESDGFTDVKRMVLIK